MIAKKMITNRNLINFLIENNALEKYIINLTERLKKFEYKKDVDRVFRRINRETNKNALLDSFDFYDTSEGYKFWAKLDRLYIKKMDKLYPTEF